MRHTLPALCTLLIACGAPPRPVEEIPPVMAEQVAAWNEGDILGYMDAYADSVCFIGPAGRTCGRKAVTANYIRRYPDQTAMGTLHFRELEVVPVGRDHAWGTGYWQLDRSSDTLRGGFSLLWEHGADGWKILRDHSY